MTGIGFSELIVIFILSLVVLDAKQIAKAMRWMSKWRHQFYRFQHDVRHQLDQMVQENPNQPALPSNLSKYEWRRWGSEQAIQIPNQEKAEAAAKSLNLIENWEVFLSAKTVACTSSLGDEIDTRELCKLVIKKGKTLLLPLIQGENLKFCKIEDLQNDLSEGSFGIQEPAPSTEFREAPLPDLIFLPGRCFDLQGNRIGRGKGFYDRYLSTCPATRVGHCFDGQVTSKKLHLAAHDIPMDYLITDKRLIPCKRPEEHD